eukprot:2555114-Amphidinium_carterae.1
MSDRFCNSSARCRYVQTRSVKDDVTQTLLGFVDWACCMQLARCKRIYDSLDNLAAARSS